MKEGNLRVGVYQNGEAGKCSRCRHEAWRPAPRTWACACSFPQRGAIVIAEYNGSAMAG